VKMLKKGDSAPVFATISLSGRNVRVPTGESWTFVSFLRYASCPMCNLRVRELTGRNADLESRGITWIAVMHSPFKRLERHLRTDAREHAVADPRRELYELYGVGRSWIGVLKSMLLPSFYLRFVQASALGFWGGAIDDSFHSMPADFLVDPAGRIQLVHYGTHIGDHTRVSAVLDVVDDAKTGNASATPLSSPSSDSPVPRGAPVPSIR